MLIFSMISGDLFAIGGGLDIQALKTKCLEFLFTRLITLCESYEIAIF
jgi:hypothetical protein